MDKKTKALSGSGGNIYDNKITDLQTGIDIKNVNGVKIYKVSTGNIITFHLGSGTLTSNYYGISLDHCNNVFVHENSIDNTGNANSSTNLRGLNAVDCETANICSNTIDKMGYSMYFDDDCQDTKVKLNNMTNYESAIRFNGAYFTTQGTATETWENTFDNALTTKKRLDGSFASGAGGIDWYYNSANSNMDVSNVTYNYNGIPSKITPVIGTNGITDCDALPLRIRETTNMSSESIEFILYPNPVSGDYIYIHNDLTEGDLSYKIYDCTGRQISSLNSYNQFLSIEVSQLKSGLYNLICYVNNEKRYTNRFIVQR